MRKSPVIAAMFTMLAGPAFALGMCDVGYESIPKDRRAKPNVDFYVISLEQSLVKDLCDFGWLPDRDTIWACAKQQMESPPLWHIYMDESISVGTQQWACTLLHEMAHLPPNNWVHEQSPIAGSPQPMFPSILPSNNW